MEPTPTVRHRGPLPGAKPTVLALVRVESDLYGLYQCLLRNMNDAGAFLETPDLLPLGTTVRISFADSAGVVVLVATGVVQRHYYVNHVDQEGPAALAGQVVRFVAFFAGE